ncbi:MAG: GNAT family N-acetyltransferase [Anaerolineales bacterium]
MTANSLLKRAPQNGLQPVDLSRHLGGIANLMEVCFSADMDAGGRSLIREMQFLSRAGPAVQLLTALPFGQPQWTLGHVWVEEGRVVGSVSTQRAEARSNTWLVANVAVHPDYRRQGIAFALMRATLDLIRGQGGAEAILQVDNDNLGAIELYRRLGFARVTTQTLWTRPARTPAPAHQPSPFDIRLRTPQEWPAQLELARLVRPEGLAWSRPLRPGSLRPSLWKSLDQFFTSRAEEHWVAEDVRRGARAGLVGSLILRFNWQDGDRMVLLVQPDFRGQLERPLLVRGLRRLVGRPWPARLEHSTDDESASAVLRELGFQPGRTLRWMRVDIR